MTLQHFSHTKFMYGGAYLKKVKGQPTFLSFHKPGRPRVYNALSSKSQPQGLLGSGEKDFQVYLQYMGMAAILFNGAEPF